MKSLWQHIILTGYFCILLTIFNFTFTLPSSLGVQQLIETSSADYLEALRTANEFLWAWVYRDAEAGIKLISNHLRYQIKDDSWLRQFMSGLSNPHHQAFTIGSGSRQGNKYIFPVVLYDFYTGEQKGFEYIGTLEIVKEGDFWRIDRLPKSSDNP